ncbi:MAG: sulfatase [Bacteroidales bacterium]|nr:sulfatase [Bacteroidales bacterium]
MIQKKIIPAVILLQTFLPMTGSESTKPKKVKSPNFILILTDDQSWVGTSFLSDPNDPRSKSDYYRTPNMERIATAGMRFSNGYAPAPYCCPTRRSITIGQTPAKHEYQQDREGWPQAYRKQLSIPQMLKIANPDYQTAHFGKWDARYDEVTPEEMGYDISDGPTTNGTGGGKNSEWPIAMEDPKLIFSLTDRACNFIEKQVTDNKPFYLQLSHYAVHLGITYTQSALDKYKNVKPGEKHFIPEFGAMTEDLDTGIGILLDKIEELDLMNNTYIIFMSDNGGRKSQPIGEEQVVARNLPLRDGKGSMYEGGIRVPFVVAGPDIPKNSSSDVPVTGLDILPTLAELSGYSPELPEAIDGGSLGSIFHNKGKGDVIRNNPFLVFHQAVDRKPQSAIRKGEYKLVKNWADNQIELFDLSTDIGEENDLSQISPEIAAELDRELTTFLQQAGAETREIRR